MTDRFGPEAALDPATFYRCYLSGLTRDSASERLATAFVLLTTGRLGLRPGELRHLHEGWIDWGRGELYVPSRDPCACADCWEAARVAQRSGDGRELATIVAEDYWSPPEDADRTVSFGWSNRLTAILVTALDTWSIFDRSVDEMVALVRETARISGATDPEPLTAGTMQASAAQFYADAGFDAAEIATLLGVPVERATPFVEATDSPPGGDAAADGATGPTDAGPDYTLLTESSPLDREPVDPTNYDAEWRQTREDERGPRPTGSPRPVAIPAGVDYTPPANAMASYHTRWRNADTVPPGPDSLADWVAAFSADDQLASGSARATGTIGGDSSSDPSQSGGPLTRQVSARFVCQSIQRGRPAGGTVLLGETELVLVTHGDGETVHHAVIPLHAVTDVAIDYCPEPLEKVFEETLAVAYRLDGDRQVAIVELPPEERRAVASAIFERRLDGVEVVLARPSVDVDGPDQTERGVLAVEDRRLTVRPDPTADPTFVLSLDDLVYAERTDQQLGDETVSGVSLRHVSNNGHTRTTRLTPVDEDARTLLARYVIQDYRRRKRHAAAQDLEPAHAEILRTLEADGATGDLSTLLGRDGSDLRAHVDTLDSRGLVRRTEGRTRLTGMGQMLLSDAVDDVTL